MKIMWIPVKMSIKEKVALKQENEKIAKRRIEREVEEEEIKSL